MLGQVEARSLELHPGPLGDGRDLTLKVITAALQRTGEREAVLGSCDMGTSHTKSVLTVVPNACPYIDSLLNVH